VSTTRCRWRRPEVDVGVVGSRTTYISSVFSAFRCNRFHSVEAATSLKQSVTTSDS
jgi:hypothetical protein